MPLTIRPGVLATILAMSALWAGEASADRSYRSAVERYSTPPRVYYDYAPVVAVREVREPGTVPGRCLPGAAPAHDALPKLGMVREHAASIASAIVQEAEAQAQAQEQSRERRAACERERVAPRVTAYEVTYRYRGTDYQRVMTRHPGDEVRVRVEVRTH